MECCIDCGILQTKENSDKRNGFVTGHNFRQRCKPCMSIWTKNYEKTPKGYLVRTYRNIKSRVTGVQKGKEHIYSGLRVLEKEDFYKYESDEVFLKLLEGYKQSGWEPSKGPSIDRIYPWFGYTKGNLQWLTQSKNSSKTRRNLELDEGKVFFTSDLHFLHKNILKYGRDKFKNVEEMNEHLVKEWNKIVPEDALVFDLGDISMGSKTKTKECLSRLNGFIVHLLGNHNTMEDYTYFNSELGEKQYFINSPILQVTINKQLIVLCHYPLADWDQKYEGSWHMYGHCHGKLKEHLDKRLDVGVDSIKNIFDVHRPISMTEVRSLFSGEELKEAIQR